MVFPSQGRKERKRAETIAAMEEDSNRYIPEEKSIAKDVLEDLKDAAYELAKAIESLEENEEEFNELLKDKEWLYDHDRANVCNAEHVHKEMVDEICRQIKDVSEEIRSVKGAVYEDGCQCERCG